MKRASQESFVHLDPESDKPIKVQVPARELLALIRDAVSTVQGLPKRFENSLVDGKPCPPKSLLTLLTYCYAHGLHGAREIEEKVRTDRAFSAAAEGCQPDHQLLSTFRRSHRDLIQSCLRRVYWFVWVKYGVRQQEFLLVLGKSSGKRVRVSQNFSQKVCAEAADTFSRAMFTDRMQD